MHYIFTLIATYNKIYFCSAILRELYQAFRNLTWYDNIWWYGTVCFTVHIYKNKTEYSKLHGGIVYGTTLV